jgi:hypothetical protein
VRAASRRPKLLRGCRREEEGLDQAQALDGTNLLGRRIRVGYAQPKRGDGAGQ